MIVIVDYGMGNLRSVSKAFEKEGARAVVSDEPKVIEKATKIVLPGVGAFPSAVKELKARKLFSPIAEKIKSGTPYLGICLGMQLLFSVSYEGEKTKGFEIVEGEVLKFKPGLKIPHMGWNALHLKKKNCPILKGIKEGERFYFVHSYYGKPKDASWTLATTDYGTKFAAALWKDNIFATQFHPEKSQGSGLRIIKNFINYK